MEQEVDKTSLALIIPCYNPPDKWAEQLVSSVSELSESLTQVPKVILVNDGSTMGVDSSHIDYLKKHLSEFKYVISPQNKGKGHALRLGVAECLEDNIIYTDIDFPYTAPSMKAIYGALLNGVDIATGFRDQSYYTNIPWFRRILSKFVRGLLKYILRLKVSDTQCGLKGFNQKGKAIFLKTTINRFLFDMEFVTIASGKKDLSIEPVNVYLRPGVKFGHMNLRVLLVESGNFIKVVFKKWFGRS